MYPPKPIGLSLQEKVNKLAYHLCCHIQLQWQTSRQSWADCIWSSLCPLCVQLQPIVSQAKLLARRWRHFLLCVGVGGDADPPFPVPCIAAHAQGNNQPEQQVTYDGEGAEQNNQ